MTEGSWDGQSGNSPLKWRPLKNGKETWVSGLEEAHSRERTRGGGPNSKSELGISQMPTIVEGAGKKKPNTVCRTLKPTVRNADFT